MAADRTTYYLVPSPLPPPYDNPEAAYDDDVMSYTSTPPGSPSRCPNNSRSSSDSLCSSTPPNPSTVAYDTDIEAQRTRSPTVRPVRHAGSTCSPATTTPPAINIRRSGQADEPGGVEIEIQDITTEITARETAKDEAEESPAQLAAKFILAIPLGLAAVLSVVFLLGLGFKLLGWAFCQGFGEGC
jgi:uncharacterized membrane protein